VKELRWLLQKITGDKEKTIIYLRLYYDLVIAYDHMNAKGYQRSFNYLAIVLNNTKEAMSGEEHYLGNIRSLVKEVHKDKAAIVRQLKKGSIDPLRVKTKLHFAQNICILRILKA